MTIGMVPATSFTARIAGSLFVTITSGLSAASSAANAGSLRLSPSAERTSSAIFCPST
jgi:hypothetical protein